MRSLGTADAKSLHAAVCGATKATLLAGQPHVEGEALSWLAAVGEDVGDGGGRVDQPGALEPAQRASMETSR